jgi:hypothetical protein
VNLEQRAKGSDPVAEAAKIILALNEVIPPSPYNDLIENTLQQMRSIYDHPGYVRIRTRETTNEAPGESDARELIRSRAWEMLSLLVAQEENR